MSTDLKKIAFYIMNSKGSYVLQEFIKKFGSEKIEYIVSSNDNNLKEDAFKEIKDISLKNNIQFFQRSELELNKEKDFIGYKFAIGWRWIISNHEKLIIFHDSLLPKYRGFSPLVNSLINGETLCGVTALHASEKYDEGCIIDQKSLEIKYPIKIKDLISKIQPLYFDLLSSIYEKVENNQAIESTNQKHSDATYSLWLDGLDYFIDWKWSAKKIQRFIDAVGYPFDGAKTLLDDSVITINDSIIVEDVCIENRHRHIGKVIFMNDGPVVICSSGLIKLLNFTDSTGNKINIRFRSRFKNYDSI